MKVVMPRNLSLETRWSSCTGMLRRLHIHKHLLCESLQVKPVKLHTRKELVPVPPAQSAQLLSVYKRLRG